MGYQNAAGVVTPWSSFDAAAGRVPGAALGYSYDARWGKMPAGEAPERDYERNYLAGGEAVELGDWSQFEDGSPVPLGDAPVEAPVAVAPTIFGLPRTAVLIAAGVGLGWFLLRRRR